MKASRAKKKTGTKKGDKYDGGVCGLVVTIDNKCGCTGTCEIMCCGKPMIRTKKIK